jgi:hypothetical protein
MAAKRRRDTAKKKSKRKKQGARRRSTARGPAKFAGVVELHPPPGGKPDALGNGTRVVVSLAEVRVGRLPEDGSRSELQLDATIRTTSENGKAVAAIWSSGVIYYVRNDSRLNVEDVVVFDGPVHQHLSLDLLLIEREMPQSKVEDAVGLAEAAATVAAELTGASGSIGTAIGAFPGVLGGILRLDGDDQVLRYSTSLFTREVSRPPESGRHLVEGVYRLSKRKKAGDETDWVTVLLEVRRVV